MIYGLFNDCCVIGKYYWCDCDDGMDVVYLVYVGFFNNEIKKEKGVVLVVF